MFLLRVTLGLTEKDCVVTAVASRVEISNNQGPTENDTLSISSELMMLRIPPSFHKKFSVAQILLYTEKQKISKQKGLKTFS